MACGIAPGILRRFGFEKLLPYQPHVWQGLLEQAQAAEHAPTAPVFGSDVAHRMVDFAERNAQRAGVAEAIQLRGGDALQRMPPSETPGLMLLNPPYGERIVAAGVAGRGRDEFEPGTLAAQRQGSHRETAQTDDGGDFFNQLASHWKKNYSGWTAWMLTPDLKLPSRMRLKETRRVPMWNGPIECRLFRFDMMKGSVRDKL
jgi:putative N6-adenine-specific DNA methylase